MNLCQWHQIDVGSHNNTFIGLQHTSVPITDLKMSKFSYYGTVQPTLKIMLWKPSRPISRLIRVLMSTPFACTSDNINLCWHVHMALINDTYMTQCISVLFTAGAYFSVLILISRLIFIPEFQCLHPPHCSKTDWSGGDFCAESCVTSRLQISLECACLVLYEQHLKNSRRCLSVLLFTW